MKALSVRQPWAHLIISGIKRVENRDWRTDYRGPLLIHAASSWADVEIDKLERRYGVRFPAELPVSAVVGVVELVNIVTRSSDRFFIGPYGFILDNAREIKPVPLAGRQRLFDVPDDLVTLD